MSKLRIEVEVYDRSKSYGTKLYTFYCEKMWTAVEDCYVFFLSDEDGEVLYIPKTEVLYIHAENVETGASRCCCCH